MKTLIKSVLTVSITAALMAQTAKAATYEVIDLGLVDDVKHTYGIERNNAGKTLISAQTGYNFPVQFDFPYLDEDDFDDIVDLADAQHDQVFELTDIQDEDALRAGNPTANDLSWTLRFLQLRASDFYQPIADTFIYTFDGQETKRLNIFDTVLPGTDEMSRTTVEVPGGITDEGWIFGTSSSPVLPLPVFIDDDDEEVIHWVQHSTDGDPLTGFASRGWISFDGENIVELVPLESTYGGLSAVNDINAHKVAVGTSSVSLNPEVWENLNDDDDRGCYDEDWVGDNIPFEVCISRYRNSLYFSNAIKWEVSENNELITTDLGTGIVNVHDEDERSFISSATSINDSGVIVGYSNFWWDEDETTPSEYERVGSFAAVFKNDKVIDFTDRDDYYESRAVDINNDGIFVGYMWGHVNGNARSKFFYADANADEIVPVFPDDFFPGSSSIAHAINENGMIVGEGEYESFNDTNSIRRRHGFVYNTRTDEFTDINNYLSCDSPYTVVEARDINENNEILATAFVKTLKLDSKGEPFIYEGEQVTEDVLRAVYLRPIDGEIEDCSKVENKVERDGASIGTFGLVSILLLGFRRKFLRK